MGPDYRWMCTFTMPFSHHVSFSIWIVLVAIVDYETVVFFRIVFSIWTCLEFCWQTRGSARSNIIESIKSKYPRSSWYKTLLRSCRSTHSAGILCEIVRSSLAVFLMVCCLCFLIQSQWCSPFWCFLAGGWRWRGWFAAPLPSWSVWLFLCMEGGGHWKKYGQRKNFSWEAVQRWPWIGRCDSYCNLDTQGVTSNTIVNYRINQH